MSDFLFIHFPLVPKAQTKYFTYERGLEHWVITEIFWVIFEYNALRWEYSKRVIFEMSWVNYFLVNFFLKEIKKKYFFVAYAWLIYCYKRRFLLKYTVLASESFEWHLYHNFVIKHFLKFFYAYKTTKKITQNWVFSVSEIFSVLR